MTVVQGSFKATNVPSTAAVFTGRSGLDFLELRMGVVRIPEVSLRIREAQRILDGIGARIDLLASAVADDRSFFINSKIASLLTAVVQVGLHDRLLRSQRSPEVLLGPASGDSAMLVCSGQISFADMVMQSAAVEEVQKRLELVERQALAGADGSSGVRPGELHAGIQQMNTNSGILPVPGMQAPLAPIAHLANGANASISTGDGSTLAGAPSTEFRAFQRTQEGGFAELGSASADLKKIMAEIVEFQGIFRFVGIGPAQIIQSVDCNQIADETGADEVTIIDSIDLDPMLSWFWKQVSPVSGIAQ